MSVVVRSFAFFLLAAATSPGEDVVSRVVWTRAPEGTALLPPESGRAEPSLRVVGTSGRAWALARINQPAVRSPAWVITGEVRYQGVEGQGYLEMWSFFPDGTRYFSRTLGTIGPMAALSGSSEWRPFRLPITNRPDGPAPVALEVNLVLPGNGTVDIGSMRLLQLAFGENPLGATSGAWLTDHQAGWLGGVGGSLIGVFGALAGWLGGRGKAARFVLSLTLTLAVVGATLSLVGLTALLLRQPYVVWYTLLLGGTISGVVMGMAFVQFRARYREIELRRIQSLDAR
jgi:hypothetical protein